MQDTASEIIKDTTPLITSDTIVFGILMICLGLIFYTSSHIDGFWHKFYKIVPALFMAYFIPAILTTAGLIAPEWTTVDEAGVATEGSTSLYYMSSRYLLPAALVLMTLSIDLKSVFNLGPKAVIMFLTGTTGIIIGGPLALLIVGSIFPDVVATRLAPVPGVGETNEIWAGLSTLSGSWIGGGANQTAMFEIYGYNPKLFGQMVFVDIVVANIWMALLIIGIGKAAGIDKWLNSDTSAIEKLKEKVSKFSKKVERNPSFADLMILAGIAFGAVSLAHFGAGHISGYFESMVNSMPEGLGRNMLSFMSSSFFWMITIATILGVLLSYTKAKNFEGAGASKFGSVFIYILVASIGMKMDLTLIFQNPGLIAIGLVWMATHAGLLILVAKLIKAPYFFLAVGSQANVGGAASAPVVAAEFHPSLATVGVLLAVFGYAIGTLGAVACTFLMQLVTAG
jgi:uncharacterized membrane protein